MRKFKPYIETIQNNKKCLFLNDLVNDKIINTYVENVDEDKRGISININGTNMLLDKQDASMLGSEILNRALYLYSYEEYLKNLHDTINDIKNEIKEDKVSKLVFDIEPNVILDKKLNDFYNNGYTEIHECNVKVYYKNKRKEPFSINIKIREGYNDDIEDIMIILKENKKDIQIEYKNELAEHLAKSALRFKDLTKYYGFLLKGEFALYKVLRYNTDSYLCYFNIKTESLDGLKRLKFESKKQFCLLTNEEYEKSFTKYHEHNIYKLISDPSVKKSAKLMIATNDKPFINESNIDIIEDNNILKDENSNMKIELYYDLIKSPIDNYYLMEFSIDIKHSYLTKEVENLDQLMIKIHLDSENVDMYVPITTSENTSFSKSVESMNIKYIL